MKQPSTLRARAAGAIRRAWSKLDHRQVTEAETLSRFEPRYHRPDPWGMESDREQFRFAHTNNIIIRELLPPSGRVDSILEIGCGEGHQSEYLARLCDQLTGIDVAPTAIARARVRRPDCHWLVGDFRDHPAVASRRFAVVTACEVLYGLNDVTSALRVMSSLGDSCLVSYFGGAEHRVAAALSALPAAGRESFAFGNVTWTALWWRTR